MNLSLDCQAIVQLEDCSVTTDVLIAYIIYICNQKLLFCGEKDGISFCSIHKSLCYDSTHNSTYNTLLDMINFLRSKLKIFLIWCYRYSTLVGIISKKFSIKRKPNEEPEEEIEDSDDDDGGLITTTTPPKSKSKRKFMKPDDS